MEQLSLQDLAVIDGYDYEHHRKYGFINRTRFYKFLLPYKGDMEVHTVAVKTGPRTTSKRVFIKTVVKGSVNDTIMHAIDVANAPISGTVVDWSPQKLGTAKHWSYGGEWAYYRFTHRCLFRMINAPVINPEVLQQSERFKWCAWSPEVGEVLSYLKIYAKHPRVELLVKSGLHHLAMKPAFVAQLDRNKGLCSFVMRNVDFIKDCRYGVDAIRTAFKRNLSLSDAQTLHTKIRYLSKVGLKTPKGISYERIYDYVAIQKHDYLIYDYKNYLRDCEKLGLDLTDTKTVFPKNLKARAKVVAAMVAEKKRREDIEQQKKLDADLKAVAKKLLKLENIKGPFQVVIPKCEKDFRREGDKRRGLNHCIGNGVYSVQHARGEYVVAFIRRKRDVKKPFVTLQFSPKNGRVEQVYGRSNSKPEKRVLDFVNGAFTRAAKRIIKVG